MPKPTQITTNQTPEGDATIAPAIMERHTYDARASYIAGLGDEGIKIESGKFP